jgi:hypothetical protein
MYSITYIDRHGDGQDVPFMETGRGCRARIMREWQRLASDLSLWLDDDPTAEGAVVATILERCTETYTRPVVWDPTQDELEDRDYETVAHMGDLHALREGGWVDSDKEPNREPA